MSRPGYFLVHRKCLTPDVLQGCNRILAWIDFISLANFEEDSKDYAIVTASYGFLAKRWGCSKDTAYRRIQHWIKEKQTERLPERCTERNAERFFLLQYAKYQKPTERVTERVTERHPEQMKISNKKISNKKQYKPIQFSKTKLNESQQNLRQSLLDAIGIEDFVEDSVDQQRYLADILRSTAHLDQEQQRNVWNQFTEMYSIDKFRYLKSVRDHLKTITPSKHEQ